MTMSEINEQLAEAGLKTVTVVTTLAGFKLTEHKDKALAKDYSIDSEKDYGEVLFFEGDCYIQYYNSNNSFHGSHHPEFEWYVTIGNSEYGFDKKDDVICYLYLHHYLIECTDLF